MAGLIASIHNLNLLLFSMAYFIMDAVYLGYRFSYPREEQPSWEQFFLEVKIPKKDAPEYAKIFVPNRITGDMLSDLTREARQDFGILLLGDCLARLKKNSIPQNHELVDIRKKEPRN